MNTLFNHFHFLQPNWLWLLLFVPLLAWAMLRRSPEVRVLARLADPSLLPYLLDGAPRSSRIPAWAVASAAVLAIIALAGPSWSRASEQLFSERAAQVVVVSMSPRMLARDVVPDRLSRARYKVRELYSANSDGMNALVAYTGESFTVAPLTTDAHSVDDLLAALAPDTMPVGGDDPGKAIDQAVDLIHHADVRGGSIVVVTDRADAAAVAAARRALAAGDRVSVLGIGTPRGGPITTDDGQFLKDEQGRIVMAPRDDDSLRALATAGGGAYAVASDDRGDIQAMAAALRDASTAKATDGATATQWEDRGPWFLLPLLPLVALGFRRGWLLVLALALLPAAPSHAASVRDAFRTRDQQAAAALAAGDAKKAQGVAESAAMRGAAAYRAGDYAAAQDALAHATDSDGQYNLGNALAKQQHYDEAIAAYDRALKANPANADAAANRKAVEDFLKQQQKDKKDDQGPKGKQDGQPDKKPGDQGKDQQGQQGQQDDPSKGQQGGQSAGGQDQKEQQGAPGQAGEGEGKDKATDAGKAQPPQGDANSKSADERAQAAQAQQALKQKMDAALAGKDKGEGKDEQHDLGQLSESESSSKLPPDVRRQLLRVPDDPGGLLRRKFMLEYQRRHGAEPEE
ncbi:tetratricopeptide repeat protein [Luteibacter aegosomatissinici]|uniref:tetratricopeptide repeat protein n=1 Tax=Luteibacter aegosomatissinici TaxID=2911539 RepID=UPI001FF74431|nr:tetratricopeptide repeat protein [Luteibacter aegosomatissinici]UPG95066.1 VWA domain-containing protein [Luteibacter aegosomatissinici]